MQKKAIIGVQTTEIRDVISGVANAWLARPFFSLFLEI